MEPYGTKNHTLMLADTENEKNKWVVALSELHRILKRNNLPNTTVGVFLKKFFIALKILLLKLKKIFLTGVQSKGIAGQYLRFYKERHLGCGYRSRPASHWNRRRTLLFGFGSIR